MLKLTKTGIGLLTKQYRSVLKKCLLFNLGLFIVALISGSLISGNAFAERLENNEEIWTYGSYYIRIAPITAELDVVATYSGHTYKTDIMESHINFYIDNVLKTSLSTGLFKLNGSLAATGIDFATNVTAGTINSSHLATTGAVNQLLNDYYYTKAQTDSVISSALSGYATQSWVTGKGYLTSVATGNIADRAVTDAKIASGITASKITQTSSYRFVTDAEKSTWNAKQNALSTAQLNAVNSGITAAKVSTYDGYATTIAGKADKATTLSGYGITNAYTKTETDSAIRQAISGFVTNDVQSLNYYYTFRVDERVEAIEFTKELRSNKKEMSSLDFMPIKSSSDLRINLIKAEDPLTFSAKTRDDSLVLMEV